MRAYLIDPVEQTVTETEYNGDYRQIYTLIEAETFDAVGIGFGDAVYVDDEGLFKEDLVFFNIKDYPQPLAGRGLVLGSDMSGASRAPHISLDNLRARVTFDQPTSRPSTEWTVFKF